MADKTAGELESALHVKKASAKRDNGDDFCPEPKPDITRAASVP